MKDIQKMRLGVLKELKHIRRFFDVLEKGVRSRDPVKVSRAYVFIKTMVHHMNEGDLSPFEIELHHALLANENKDE